MAKGAGGGGRGGAAQARRAYLKRMGITASRTRGVAVSAPRPVGPMSDVEHARAVLAGADLGAPVPQRYISAAVRTLERAGQVVRR